MGFGDFSIFFFFRDREYVVVVPAKTRPSVRRKIQEELVAVAVASSSYVVVVVVVEVVVEVLRLLKEIRVEDLGRSSHALRL